MTVKISVLAENSVALSMGLIGEHGWSALIENNGARVLFDTGQGMCLSVNPAVMNVKLDRLDAICLSHGHFDHTRGLPVALKTCRGAKVFCHPAALERKMVRHKIGDKEIELDVGMPGGQADLEKLGAVFSFSKESTEVAPGIFLITEIPMTNPFESIEEGFFVQTPSGPVDDTLPDDGALAIKGDKGLSVILGCAHRGMINTLERALQVTGESEVYSVWGGTHLLHRNPDQIQQTIRALESMNIRKLGVGHCTGDHVTASLLKYFGSRFQFVHVGTQAEL